MAVEKVAFPKAHGADGVAVICPFWGDELGPLPLSRLGEGLDDHFQAGFHRGGAVVGKEDPGEGRGISVLADIRQQLLGQSDGGLVGQTEKGGVGNFSKLVTDGFVQFGMAMTVKVGPDGGVAVEVALAVGSDEPRAFAGNNRDGMEGGIHPG